MQTISPNELNQKLGAGEVSRSQIIDVRTPVEVRECHIPGTTHLELDSLSAEALRAKGCDEGIIYLLCQSGGRAAKAQSSLTKSGLTDTIVVEGGISSWEKSNLVVEKGKAVMSLERQVRIAAGGLALLGALLGFTLHPNWHFLSGFVGAGLVFAGVTNTCTMGILIARMPWNR